MDLNLINERYTDTQYHSYFLLKESWDTFSPSQKRFIKECEDITHSVFPELLQEGPLDKFRSKAAGAIAGAKNLGKSLTGRGSEAENVEQVKVNKRVQIFQSGVGKVLGELQRDLGKMGIQGEDHPTIQAINYINGSANQIGTAEYPIEVKAGLGGRMADKALEWTNTKIQKILTDIKAAADQEEQIKFPGMETFKLSDSIKRSAGKSLQAIESFAKKNPKWTNFSVGVIVAASRLAGVPGSGILTGLLLRSAIGVIKGENVEQAVGNAAKVAAVGTVAGAAIGELGAALSDNADQVEGALDKAGDAGENAIDADTDGSSEMAQVAIKDYKETLAQSQELGIPKDYKLSFNNGEISTSSPELRELLNSPNKKEILQQLYDNEIARLELDDWLPKDKQLSDRALDIKTRVAEYLSKLANR